MALNANSLRLKKRDPFHIFAILFAIIDIRYAYFTYLNLHHVLAKSSQGRPAHVVAQTIFRKPFTWRHGAAVVLLMAAVYLVQSGP